MSDDANEYEHNPIDITEFEEVDFSPPVEYQPQFPTVDSEGIEKDAETDYEKVRQSYYELVSKGQAALNNLLDIAASSEQPRAFEVAAQMIKTISDTNDRIVELQSQMRKIAEQDYKLSGESQDKGGVTNNNIFVGTMDDFQQYIKQLRSGNLPKYEDE